MKKIILILLLSQTIGIAQQSYYNDVDITLEGQALYNELQDKISNHNTNYTYGDFRNTMKITDANPSNSSEVLLIYGFNDTDNNCTTDRTRDNDLFGGGSCEYNREHTFARSAANPPMGSASNGSNGIVADPHNLRPSDVQRNGTRGSKKFAAGSGNSGDVGANWYPGNEWKGDVARIVMYMYVRYGDQCLPSLTGVGSTQGSTNMLQLFLEWNADDPVSEVEEQRNPRLESEYGSRNPFIDNPALATQIWGGPQAEDIWGVFSVEESTVIGFDVFPNPAKEHITISSTSPFRAVTIYNIAGQKVYSTTLSSVSKNTLNLRVSNFPKGIYLVEVDNTVQKLIIK